MCKIRRLRPLELFLKAPGTDIPEAHPRFSSVLPPISGHSCKTSVVGQRGPTEILPPVPLHSGGIGTLRDYNPIIDVPNHYWRFGSFLSARGTVERAVVCTHTQAFQSYLYVPPSMRSLYLGHCDSSPRNSSHGDLPDLRVHRSTEGPWVRNFLAFHHREASAADRPLVNHHLRCITGGCTHSFNLPDAAGWFTHFVSRKVLTIGRVECGLIGLGGRLHQQVYRGV